MDESDYDVIQPTDFIEPGIDCPHLCYNCDKSSYCWDSDLVTNNG